MLQYENQFIKKVLLLGLQEFWAREKPVQAKFVLVELCTSSFVKLRASEILSTCYPRNGLYLKIRASEIRTSENLASQGPPVLLFTLSADHQLKVETVKLPGILHYHRNILFLAILKKK